MTEGVAAGFNPQTLTCTVSDPSWFLCLSATQTETCTHSSVQRSVCTAGLSSQWLHCGAGALTMRGGVSSWVVSGSRWNSCCAGCLLGYRESKQSQNIMSA